jgi:hypothetical protein
MLLESRIVEPPLAARLRQLTMAYRGDRIAWVARCQRLGVDMKPRMMVVLFCGLGLLLLQGFGAPRIGERFASAQPAKLGFSYLSQAQMKDLWRRADNYAMAEAFLKQCGSPSHIERRMMLAARDCIEARALNRVAAYFRRKLAELSNRHTFVCDTDQSKALVKSTRAQIDRDVAEVRSMCRACLIC